YDRLTVAQVAVHPLDGVGVDIGGGNLHRCRQVHDHRAFRGGSQHINHFTGDVGGEVQFSAGEGLGAVLVDDLGVDRGGGQQLLFELLAEPGAAGGNVDDAGLVLLEHHFALDHGGGVVEVNDGTRGALQRLKGPFDQVFAGLGEDLDVDV